MATVKKEEKTLAPQKYVDLISKSDKQVQSEELALEVQKAKSGLEVTIAKTNLDLANARQKLIKTQCAVPYDVNAELEAFQAVNELQGGLEFAQNILSERF